MTLIVNRIKQRIPMAESQLDKVRELFDLYDSDGDSSLTLNELAVLLQEIGNKITALPAVRIKSSSSVFLPLTTFHHRPPRSPHNKESTSAESLANSLVNAPRSKPTVLHGVLAQTKLSRPHSDTSTLGPLRTSEMLLSSTWAR